MTKIGRAAGLIAYDTDNNIERRLEGQPALTSSSSPAHSPLCRDHRHRRRHHDLHFGDAPRATAINVMHDRNPIYVRLSDGSVRNGYTVRIVNKQLRRARFHPRRSTACRPRMIEFVGEPPRRMGSC